MDSGDMQIMKLKSDFNAEELSAQIQHLQQDKTHVKTNYVLVNAKKQFLKSLHMDPSEWLTIEDADSELEKSTAELQGVKTELRDVKESMQSLCESAEEGYSLLCQKKQILGEKLTELEEKKQLLVDRQTATQSPGFACEEWSEGKTAQEVTTELSKKIASAEKLILACKERIMGMEGELQHLDSVITSMQQVVANNNHDLQKLESEKERQSSLMTQLTNALEKLVGDLERLGGVKVVPLSSTAARVEFPVSQTEESDIQLALSLEFFDNNLGDLCLQSAKVNVESIDATHLLETAVATNDVSTLVTKLKSRWLSHQPLLSEISHLRLRSAVDWIQEESLLRVMVGRGGSVVCTLAVPQSCPLSGEVTLADIKGHGTSEDVMQIKPAGYERTLTSWVDCLETKFGRP